MSLSIAVFSDPICPWCLMGKRRLERALDELGLRDRTTIRWLPFELNPEMPEEGITRAQYRTAKFGAEKAAQLDREMAERGRAEGIPFAFDRMERTPSTRKAHLLIAHAARTGQDGAVVDALFQAYFLEARDIGAEDVLLDVAAACGLDRDAARAALADPLLRSEVEALAQRGREMGISGVPFFIVDGTWAMSGAQPAEQWIAALTERAGARPAAAG